LLGAGLARTPFTRPKRPRALPKPVPQERTLLLAGDVMLSRHVGEAMVARQDWDYPFRKIAPVLRGVDLAFANLECPISDTGRDLHHLYSFRADPRAIEGLNYAGFLVLSLANNHTDDWDRPALLDTVRRLREAGLVPVGAGANLSEAHCPAFVTCPPGSPCRPLADRTSKLEIRNSKFETRNSRLAPRKQSMRGGEFRFSSFDLRPSNSIARAPDNLTIAFLAYVDVKPEEAAATRMRAGVAWLDPDLALADIRFARRLADLVIVSVHWGVEYARSPAKEQVDWARQMIDAGADLVVGSHPHVVQPLEEYRGHWIAYSLGNFVFDQPWPITRQGLMLKVTVNGKRITRVVPMPTTIDEMQADLAEIKTQPAEAGR